jgi:hypothetical protein
MGRKTPIAVGAVVALLVMFWGAGVVYWLHDLPRPVAAVAAHRPVPSVLASSSFPIAVSPPVALRPAVAQPDQATIAAQLSGGDSDAQLEAVRHIRALAMTDPRSLALGLPQWVDPLLESNHFSDLEQVTLPAILERPFDTPMVRACVRARVTAFMAEGEYPQALKEAKAFYNVVSLLKTPDAIELLVQVLSKTSDASTVARFRMEQSVAAESREPPVRSPAASFDSPPPQGGAGGAQTVLQSIRLDPSPYFKAIGVLEGHRGSNGKHSPTNCIARGNLWLLSDQPARAEECFREACKLSDGGKDLRNAVEGVGRAIRDSEGNLAPANAFMMALRQDPEVAGAALDEDGSPTPDALRAASFETQLSSVKAPVPELEEERAAADVVHGSADEISVQSDFECATPVLARLRSPTRLTVALIGVAQMTDWFFFRVDGAAGKIVRIDLTGPEIEMSKWCTENPLICDARDLSALHSDDSPENGVPRTLLAFNGARIPSTKGQPWRYVPDVWQSGANTLSFVCRFETDSVYVAMRVPYTPSSNQRYMTSLRRNGLAKVIEVGRSKGGRPLLLVEFAAHSAEAHQRKPCALIYAGEHADEYDASWVAQGAIDYLLTDRARDLRDAASFLIIPTLDPDASAQGRHAGIISSFSSDRASPEAIAYANWFQSWVMAGNRLDVVLDLHNVQSSETNGVACALLEGHGVRGTASIGLHHLIIKQLRQRGLDADDRPWMFGWSPLRFGGWLAHSYGPITLAYEINSQAPSRHLTITDLRSVGGAMVESVGDFMSGHRGTDFLDSVDELRQGRLAELRDGSSRGASGTSLLEPRPLGGSASPDRKEASVN